MFLAITEWTHLWFLYCLSLSRDFCLPQWRSKLYCGWQLTVHPYWEEGLNCPSPVEGGEILLATSWVAGSASTVAIQWEKLLIPRGWTRDQTQGIRASHTLCYWQSQSKEFQPKLTFIRIEYPYSRYTPPKVRGVEKLTWRLYRYETKLRITSV